VVDVHVGDDQRPHLVQRKADLQPVGAGAVGRGLGAMEQAAIGQHRLPARQRELVARTGDAVHGTVVGEAQGHVWTG
jgi:hypothetical protein